MARADRAFGALVAITLTLAGWLSLALLFTLFPAIVDRLVRSSSDSLSFCTGVFTNVHAELPPFGAAALGLAAMAVAPAALRAARLLSAARVHAGPTQVDAPARLRDAASRVGIAGRVLCVDDRARYAYCAGLLGPRVYVSLGAVRVLTRRELEAVLWHEAHHLRRRDPLRALIARGLAALFRAAPVVGELAARFEIATELDADRAALLAQGTARGLAGALLALGRGVPPPDRAALMAWSMSSRRVDQLAGVSAENLLPGLSRRAVSWTAIALMVGLVLAIGQAARTHLLPPTFLNEAAGAVGHLCPIPLGGPLL